MGEDVVTKDTSERKDDASLAIWSSDAYTAGTRKDEELPELSYSPTLTDLAPLSFSDALQGIEKLWMMEHQRQQDKCRLNSSRVDCSDYIFSYSTLESIIRTHNVIPSIHAILTYAHALKAAWKSNCKDVPGFCPEVVTVPPILAYYPLISYTECSSQMATITHRDFMKKYLQPLTFVHSPEDRSPLNLNGRKAVHTFPNQISDMKVALTLFRYNQKDGFSYQQVGNYFISAMNSHWAHSRHSHKGELI